MPIAEGGGPRPPYRESFLENIVNVSWQSTGAKFVSGDLCCYMRSCSMDRWDSEQKWQMIGCLTFGDGGGTYASTYGNAGRGPTFLMGGISGNLSGKGLIMRSNDGVKWENMFIFPSTIAGLVWVANPVERSGANTANGLFYAQSTDQLSSGRCYYSTDGKTWFFANAKFADYCKGIIPGVPDGVYGYDPKADVVIYPSNNRFYRASDFLGVDIPNDSVLVIVNASTKDLELFLINIGLTDCKSVAFCGGIWMAGGMGVAEEGGRVTTMTLSSVDGGHSWFVSTFGRLGAPFDDEIETISGGPIRDFR